MLHFCGFQSFFSVFTQISPDGYATFGWKIFVRKCPFGGTFGKSLLIVSLQRNTPPSYGVLNVHYFVIYLLGRPDDVCLDVGHVAVEVLIQHHSCNH